MVLLGIFVWVAYIFIYTGLPLNLFSIVVSVMKKTNIFLNIIVCVTVFMNMTTGLLYGYYIAKEIDRSIAISTRASDIGIVFVLIGLSIFYIARFLIKRRKVITDGYNAIGSSDIVQ